MVLQVKEKPCLAIFLIDDFHNIHTIRQPDTTTTSQAVHMASCLLDIQKSIPAIKIPGSNVSLHRVVIGSGEDMCRGGICTQTVNNVMEEFMLEYHQTYLASLPDKFTEFDAKAAKACLQELR